MVRRKKGDSVIDKFRIKKLNKLELICLLIYIMIFIQFIIFI